MVPLANQRRLHAIEALVADTRASGARLQCGGARIGNKGYFFQPTVFSDVPDTARIMSEEPFGPIAPITSFRSVDEVQQKVNALPYGLAAYVMRSEEHTSELQSLMRISYAVFCLKKKK